MASLMQDLKLNGCVPLEAYGHQVGGHHLLVKFKKDTICKPLITREHYFYESIPPEIRTFTPGYYGVITVSLERQPSGEMKIVAYPRQTIPSLPTGISKSSLSCSTHASIHGGVDSITSKAQNGEAYVNPWSSECKKITREKLLSLGDETNSFNEGLYYHIKDLFSISNVVYQSPYQPGPLPDYVVLENLTSRFSAPSVLDLKIGTRQHGDNVPAEKVRKHTATCANSTSRTLGARICGLQKYDAAKNEYIFRDKYYGRTLTEDGFREELRSFLHNGLMFRSDLLQNIVTMLEELAQVIERQDSYRFFSSSLLIIYDGAESLGDEDSQRGKQETRTNGTHTCSFKEMREHVDIRMIDFGHSTPTGHKDSVNYTGPDTGYLFGLQTMIAIFKQMMTR